MTATTGSTPTTRPDELSGPAKTPSSVERREVPAGLEALRADRAADPARRRRSPSAITIQRANAIARTTVNTSISSAAKLFQRFRAAAPRTPRPAGRSSSARDPTFVAYIQTSLTRSARSGPAPRHPARPAAPAPRRAAGLDLVSIARPARAAATGVRQRPADAARRPGARRRPHRPAGASPRRRAKISTNRRRWSSRSSTTPRVPVTAGVLVLGNQLYHAAVAPIAAGANHGARRLPGQRASHRRRLRQPHRRVDQRRRALRRRRRLAVALARTRRASACSRWPASSRSSTPASRCRRRRIEIDRSNYVMTGEPLQSAGRRPSAPRSSSARSTRELAPFSRSRTRSSPAAACALLLAFLLSWVIAKRVTRPIEELAGIAQAVTAGDYSVHPNIDRSDEVGILGRSFAKMITVAARQGRARRAVRADGREVGRSGRRRRRAQRAGQTRRGNRPRHRPARPARAVGEGDAANVIATVGRVMKHAGGGSRAAGRRRARDRRPSPGQRLPRRARDHSRHPRRARDQRRAGATLDDANDVRSASASPPASSSPARSSSRRERPGHRRQRAAAGACSSPGTRRPATPTSRTRPRRRRAARSSPRRRARKCARSGCRSRCRSPRCRW